MALVGWADVCKLVDKGGIGVRRLQDQNFLFLLKMGFNLVAKMDALRVRILRNKYNIYGIILEDLHRSNCSRVFETTNWLIFGKTFA